MLRGNHECSSISRIYGVWQRNQSSQAGRSVTCALHAGGARRTRRGCMGSSSSGLPSASRPSWAQACPRRSFDSNSFSGRGCRPRPRAPLAAHPRPPHPRPPHPRLLTCMRWPAGLLEGERPWEKRFTLPRAAAQASTMSASGDTTSSCGASFVTCSTACRSPPLWTRRFSASTAGPGERPPALCARAPAAKRPLSAPRGCFSLALSPPARPAGTARRVCTSARA